MSDLEKPNKILTVEKSVQPGGTETESLGLASPAAETVGEFMAVMNSKHKNEITQQFPSELISPINQMLSQAFKALDPVPPSDGQKSFELEKKSIFNEFKTKNIPIEIENSSLPDAIPVITLLESPRPILSPIPLEEISVSTLNVLIQDMVNQLLVAEGPHHFQQIRIQINSHFFEGFELVFQAKSGQVQIDFLCHSAESRNRLTQMISKGGLEIARRCKRDMLFRIHEASKEDEPSTLFFELVGRQ